MTSAFAGSEEGDIAETYSVIDTCTNLGYAKATAHLLRRQTALLPKMLLQKPLLNCIKLIPSVP